MLLQRTRPSRSLEPSTAPPDGRGAAPRPGTLARAAARLRASALDAALAAGEDPAASGPLTARALALSSHRARNALADGLDRLGDRGASPPFGARPRAGREPARANAAALRELAELLRGPAPLYVRGVALARVLLADGLGPAYHGDGAALRARLAEVRTHLRGG